MVKRFFFFVAACFCLLGTLRAEELTPSKMTPLVGRGRVINQIDKSLIDVVGQESSLNNLIDTNINNYASFSGLAGIDVAYHQIISVKDVNYDYAGGLEAGFVMQSVSNGSNLLTADVLKMFVIETYLDSVKQESSVYEGATSGLLDLNLITVASDGKTRVSIRTTKPFDEVRLAVAGVNVEAFRQLKLYYAYVGENEMQPITQTTFYPNASVHGNSITGIGDKWTTAMWNWPNQKEKLVGANSETNGVGFGTLSSLVTEPRVTIKAGKEIPSNTEVGFVIESGSVLAINLLKNTVLSTYDVNDNEVESKTIVSVLGLSALGGGKTTVSMITTKPCQQVKIQFGGLNIDVGGTKIYHAYTRDANVYVEDDCDLKLSSDIAVCDQSSIQLTGINGVIWSIESQPTGANATISSTGLVENMTVDGPYTIKAQKGDCIDYVTINRSPSSNISSECNRPIVGDNVEPFAPAGGGCLLCLSPDLDNNSRNVVDADLTNYIEYTKGLDLLSNTSIYGVQRTDGSVYQASASAPRRTGFIMQATDQFLTADVLKFFVIKTYLDDKLQESSPIEQNDAVTANLIGGMSNQMRYSFVATKPFNRITLWTAGVLSLNLSKFRIYYAFEEPAQSDCMAQLSSTSCITLLSAQHGVMINYAHTGFNGVANVGATMRNLANVIDGNMNTYAFINKTAGVAANTTLSIKANQVFEHGYQAGFVVEEQTWLGNVDLLRQLRIRTYLNGVETGDEAIQPEVLSLDLIGSFGKSLVTITPTMPFDEMQLDISGLLDALVELKVYGAFVQPDTDGDGIPDCIDKNPCGVELIPSLGGPYCVGDQVQVKIEGEKTGKTYSLQVGDKSYDFISEVATFNADVSGQLTYIIKENGVDVYSDIITIHPLETQWTGAISTDWNNWNNWTEGVPYSCTNVIIPSKSELAISNGIHYPILEEGIEYICNGIHFKPGAEVVRQDLLNYGQAWVSINMTPEKNYMLSIPLTDTYSGDFFIPNNTPVIGKDLRNPFKEEIKGNVNRTKPFVISQVWNNGAWATLSGEEVLNRKYNVGESIAIKTKRNSAISDTTQLEMLLGKADAKYGLFTSTGKPTGDSISIVRQNMGQYIFPHIKGQSVSDFSINLSTTDIQNIFVIANPFMCHLSVDSLFTANEGLIERVWINGNILNNPESEFSEAKLTELTEGDNCKIAPTTSFFIKTSASTLSLTFKKNMMVAGDYEVTQQAAPQTRAANQGSSNNSKQVLSSLKAYTRNGEGIIESADKVAKLQVFAVSGKLILERQNVTAPVTVPLSEGVNIIKVQTENEVKTFKLIK